MMDPSDVWPGSGEVNTAMQATPMASLKENATRALRVRVFMIGTPLRTNVGSKALNLT